MARTDATIYLMEHALTPGDGTAHEQLHGWTGASITPAGKQLALKTAAWLKDHANVGETYASDLPRGLETAEAVRAALGIEKPVVPRRGLRPMDVGTLAGQPKEDVEGILSDLVSRPWAKAPGSTQGLGKFLGVWGQELHRTIQEALGEEYDCLYVTHSHNLGMAAHVLSGGTAPKRLDSPVGAAGLLVLHVSDKGGHVAIEPGYDPSNGEGT